MTTPEPNLHATNPWAGQGFPVQQQQRQAQKPRRKRRVFIWIFGAFQVLFIAWLISALVQGTDPAHSQVVAGCAHGAWQGVFSSYQDCMTHYRVGLADAGNTGKGIAAALIIGLWVAFDVIVGGGYAIYRLATRGSHS